MHAEALPILYHCQECQAHTNLDQPTLLQGENVSRKDSEQLSPVLEVLSKTKMK